MQEKIGQAGQIVIAMPLDRKILRFDSMNDAANVGGTVVSRASYRGMSAALVGCCASWVGTWKKTLIVSNLCTQAASRSSIPLDRTIQD